MFLKTAILQQVIVRLNDQCIILFLLFFSAGFLAVIYEQLIPSGGYAYLINVHLSRCVRSLTQVHRGDLACILFGIGTYLRTAFIERILLAYQGRLSSRLSRVDIEADLVILRAIHKLIFEHHEIVLLDLEHLACILLILRELTDTQLETDKFTACIIFHGTRPKTTVELGNTAVTEAKEIIRIGPLTQFLHIDDGRHIDFSARVLIGELAEVIGVRGAYMRFVTFAVRRVAGIRERSFGYLDVLRLAARTSAVGPPIGGIIPHRGVPPHIERPHSAVKTLSHNDFRLHSSNHHRRTNQG